MSLTYNQAVEQTITAGEQIHQIVNGTATTEVTVEDGSKVPSIRKALLDNFYFKDPIAWQVGQTENVFNQLRQFTDGSWWYAPSATASNPISMGSTPVGDSLWKIYDFDAIGKLEPRIDEALRRSYAEAGYNLVAGSFEAGGTVGAATDVLLYASQGKAYAWGGAFPKVVPPSSSPASTGGVGAGAWVDRTDVTLRAELALPTGSSFVGFSGGSVDIFAARTAEDVLRGALRFDDFKGNTDDERWVSMVAYMSAATVTTIAVEFAARIYTFTVDPGLLTKPFVFVGKGGRNTLLKFTGCNGIRADLTTYNSRQTQSKVAHLSVIADSQNTKKALYFKGATGAGVHAPALVIDGVDFMGLRDLYPTGNDGDEWATAIHLESVDEVHLKDVYVCGSRLNATYAARTSSKGIFANTVNGLRVSRGVVYTTGTTGIEMVGRCEGAIFESMTMVGMDIGISFHDLLNPSNNHVITGTHISAYTKGIEFRKNVDPSAHPVAVYISNSFILEREGNASKPDYTALDCYVNSSVISAVTIQSNATTSPVRRAIRISNQNNTVSNAYCYLQTELLNIDAVSTDQVFYNNVRGKGIGSMLTGATQYATGAALNAFAAAPEYDVRAAVFRVKDTSDNSTFEISGSRHLIGGSRQSANQYFDFRTVVGGTAGYDGRILFSGGSASVNGQADATIYAATTSFAGNIAPQTANNYTVGTSGRPWSGGFTQAAFTVTSDERMKTAPLDITDAMLDAAAEVDWVQYQYLDRVEAKGPDGARWHFGAVAQRYVEAFARHGLDAHEYGFICHDEWEASPEQVDENGEVVSAAVEAGDRYGIRYEEALALEAAYQRRRCDRIEARLKAAGL